MEFGAINGSTSPDSTMAIARAQLAAGTGGEIYVPTGTFKVNDRGAAFRDSTSSVAGDSNNCIQINLADQRLYGEGVIEDVLSDTDNSVVEVVAGYDNITIDGLKVTATDDSNSGTGIKIGAVADCVVKNCNISTLNTGIHLAGSTRAQVTCNKISGWVAYAISIGTVAGDVTCNECNVSNNTTLSTGSPGGTVLVRAVRSVVSGNYFETNAGTNVWIDESTDLVFNGNTLYRKNTTLTAGSNNIMVDDSVQVMISNNSITTIDGCTHSVGLDEIELIGGASTTGISIIGNNIRSKQVMILLPHLSTGIVINNNNTYAPGTNEVTTRVVSVADSDTPRYGSICGNVMRAATTAGSSNEAIGIGSGKNFTCAGNQITNYFVAFEDQAADSGNLFYGNSMSGVGGAPVVDTGGGAAITTSGANLDQD
jgi:hypothetical protein